MKPVIVFLLTLQLVAFSKPDQAAKEANEKRGKIAAEVASLTVDASDVGKGGDDEKAYDRISDSISERLKLGEVDQEKLRRVVVNTMSETKVGFLTGCYTEAFSSTFSTEELTGIRDFYKSDAGSAFLARQADHKPLSPEEESGVREFLKSDAGKAFLAKRKEFGGTFEKIRKASTKDLQEKIMERIRKEAPELLEKDKTEQGAPQPRD
ncbi:MAG: DUF2059 domain-containing protein [Verrucomicrobiota bacterium]